MNMRLSSIKVTLLSITFYTLLTVTSKTIAFRCYVCDSKDDIECTENLPEDSRLISQDCNNITGAKYCIKTTNIYAGEFGTKRFCSANDHGSYCKFIRQPTGDREYRSCVLTCESDNCNRASTLLERQNILYVALFLTLLCYLLMTTLTCNQYSHREHLGRT